MKGKRKFVWSNFLTLLFGLPAGVVLFGLIFFLPWSEAYSEGRGEGILALGFCSISLIAMSALAFGVFWVDIFAREFITVTKVRICKAEVWDKNVMEFVDRYYHEYESAYGRFFFGKEWGTKYIWTDSTYVLLGSNGDLGGFATKDEAKADIMKKYVDAAKEEIKNKKTPKEKVRNIEVVEEMYESNLINEAHRQIKEDGGR